ncbi:thiamine pyrophosphate-binding protein [Nocardioides sp. zg-ZUI104]|uniref:thiamine pyrophosphate-binding protein n=1 Tax=Nocardioides faecalis TaxID=2803858 RepID=UPI001BCB8A47|nr:thiamine pyrophosphate-binding protein [Nocardioides faecalis]MBS4754564.1 thiamine pyrophosphate-binding protein [Nocardioides faecalis]
MYVHHALAQALRQRTGTMFGLIGDGNLFMVDSYRRLGGRYVALTHEAATVTAAGGYHQVSSEVGVATVTHGPALTNTCTALVDAVRGEVPLVVVAGDTATKDHLSLQSIAQREVVLATGAGFEQLRSATTVAEDVATVFRRCVVECRPVVLNVPVDLQWQEVEEPSPASPVTYPPVAPDTAALADMVGVLASAARPLIVAGRGAVASDGGVAVLALAERVGAVLATTLRAKGLFDGHPSYVGTVGTLADERCSAAVQRADVVCALGASLNEWTTARGSLLAGKRVIHCDVSPASLGRYQQATVNVLGDARAVAEAAVALLDEAEVPAVTFAEQMRAFEPSPPVEAPAPADGRVDFVAALHEVERMVPADRVLVLDGGRFWTETVKTLRVRTPRSYVHTVSFGSIGLGLGSAIGAAVAGQGRPTLLVAGDGGFMLSGISELHTAVREGLDLIVVVMNDGSYGAEHIQFRRRDMDPGLSQFEWPDFAAVATSLGAAGVTVARDADFAAAARLIEERDRPVLIDSRIDPDHVPSGR